jgi:hypothetical protein
MSVNVPPISTARRVDRPTPEPLLNSTPDQAGDTSGVGSSRQPAAGAPAIVTQIEWPEPRRAAMVALTRNRRTSAMFRALLIAIVSAVMLGACAQATDTGSTYRHGGGGPPFSSRILP